jgi:hypothetical protein
VPRLITWYPPGCDPMAPDGTEVVLQGSSEYVPSAFSELVGASGFGAAAYTATWASTPGIDGGSLRSVTAGVGEMTWRFLLETDTPAQFRREFRKLVAATTPKRGLGILQVGHEIGASEGDVRQTPALVVGGLQGDPLLARGPDTTAWPFDLVLQTPDPYWYRPEPARAVWRGREGHPFLPLAFPWSLSPYGMEASDPLELDGDAESWATFTLSGPFSRARFTNDRTGKAWQIARSSTTGQSLTVTTKPGNVRVRTSSGGNAYGLLDPKSQLFPIAPGDSISVEADGAEQSTTFVLEAPVTWLTAP